QLHLTARPYTCPGPPTQFLLTQPPRIMPCTSPYPTKVKPQDGKSNCSKSLCESHDHIVQHVATTQGVRMADDDPGCLTIHIRAREKPLASPAVSRKDDALALHRHSFLLSDCGY